MPPPDPSDPPNRRDSELLLEELMPELRAFIRLKCGPLVRAQESSSDLIQSVCRELITDGALDEMDEANRSLVRGRVFKIAEHKIIDKARFWKREKRDVGRRERMPSNADVLGLAYSRAFSPSREMMATEAMERIEKAFDQLPERYRDVILMARMGGLSYEELGQEFGCSAHSARTLVSRALARLAAVLGPGFLG